VAKLTVKGKSFGDYAKLLRLATKEVKDVRPTLNRVVYPWYVMHVEEQFRTAGKHGGQAWSFRGEPKYQHMKTRRHGMPYGKMPMLLPDDRAKLLPSLIDANHPDSLFRLMPGQLILGSRLEYADRLFNTGGIGPYGERYPGRDPFQMTPVQERERDRLIEADLRQRLKRYIPLPGRYGST
jgi:hypothetical protein